MIHVKGSHSCDWKYRVTFSAHVLKRAYPVEWFAYPVVYLSPRTRKTACFVLSAPFGEPLEPPGNQHQTLEYYPVGIPPDLPLIILFALAVPVRHFSVRD